VFDCSLLRVILAHVPDLVFILLPFFPTMLSAPVRRTVAGMRLASARAVHTSSAAAAAVSNDEVAALRAKYMAPTYARFQTPLHPPNMDRAFMQHMFDADGRKYLDCLANNLTISVGHCHPAVSAAAAEQATKVQHVSSMYHSAPASLLARDLADLMPETPSGKGGWRTYFSVSGTDAVAVAVTLARAHAGTNLLASVQNAYHGSHGLGMGASGIAACSHDFPEAQGVIHLPLPGANANEETMYDDTRALLASTVDAVGGGRVAGTILEPLQGYGGIIPLPPKFAQGLAEETRARGGLVISDEIQTGLGRCGNQWAFEQLGVVPDIVVIAKGIGNGFPIAACIATDEVWESFDKTGRFLFDTYGGNPVCAAAGRAVLKTLREENFTQHCSDMGALFSKKVHAEIARLEAADDAPDRIVSEVRGAGLMWGVEIADPAFAFRVYCRMHEFGVLVGLGGKNKNVLRFMPPMCVQPEDVDTFIDAFGKSVVVEHASA